jgi:PAS domain S-box-containing protein
MLRRWSIRTQLLALALAIAVPLVGLLGWNLYARHGAETRAAEEQALRLAELAAAAASRYVRQARSLLLGLAERPAVHALDPERCDPILGELPALSPRLVNVLTLRLDGRVVCSVLRPAAGASAVVPRSLYLDRLAQSGELTIGIPNRGFVTGRWVLTVAHPLRDAQGRLTGAVGATFDLLNFPIVPDDPELPQDAVLTIVDSRGTVVARSREGPRFVGTDQGKLPIVAAMLADRRGVREEVGIDGLRRIYAFTPVPGADWIAFAGLPAEALFASRQADTRRGIVLAATALLLVTVFAAAFARGIARPIRAVSRTAREIAEGSVETRAPESGPAEVATVAREFNRMLESLQRGEARLRETLESMSDGFVGLDRDWRYTYVNRAAAGLFGRSAESLLGRNYYEEYPEARGTPFERAYRKAMDERVPVFIEERYAPWDRWFENRIYPTADGISIFFHEITERKRAEKALAESEERLRLATEAGQVGTWDWDTVTNQVRWDPALLRLFGLEPGQFSTEIGAWLERVHPEDRERLRTSIRNALKDRARYAEEFRIRGAGGEERWVAAEGRALGEPGGRAVRMIGVARDVTERKRAEEALRESEARYQLAVSSGDVWDIDLRTGVGQMSSNFKRQLGYEESEIEDSVEALDALVHPEDLPRLKQALRDHFRDRIPYRIEFRARAKSGEYRWFVTGGQTRRDASGTPVYMAGTTFDITERKRAEEALRESERKLRQLIDGTGPAIFIGLLSPEGVLAQANRPALAAAELALEDVTGRLVWDTYWCSWSQSVQQVFRTAVARAAAGQADRFDIQIRLAEGRLAWIDLSLEPLRDDSGRVIYLVASAMVIEERKRAEAELRESEERFRAIAANTPDHIVVQDRDLRYELVVNPQLGLTEAVMLGKTDVEILGPEDGAKLTAIKQGVLATGEPLSLEVPLPNAKGETEYFDGSYIPRRDAEGRIDGLIGYFRNVTERKRAEEALRESNRQMNTLIGNLPGAAYRCRNDPAYMTEFVSEGIAALTGYPSADFLEQRRHMGDLIHPEDRERVWSEIQDALARDRPFEVTYRIIGASGAQRWVWERGLGIRDAKGTLVALEGFVTDVTDRTRAEDSLRESEARFRTVFHASSIPASIATQSSGVLIEVNDAYCGFFGYAREELVGRTTTELGLWVDPADRQAITDLLKTTERAIAVETRRRRRSGEVRNVVLHIDRIRLRGERCTLTTLIDVTERREAEGALREANRRLHALSMRLLEVQEAERAAIARELHDEIGQSLTALKLTAQMLARKASGETAKKIGECVALAARTLDQTRSLTLDLRPPELDHLGLAASLREHLGRVAATAGFGGAFSADADYRALDRRLATAAFRVAQEALTNAARHAGARNVALELRTEDATLVLAVADDGRGFDLAQARERALRGESMGVLGMEERVALAGGRLEIATRPGAGTRVEARFPLGVA